jgi:hypothetical protein
LNPGLLVSEADAMSTAPRRQGKIDRFFVIFQELVLEEHEECGCQCLSVTPSHCLEPDSFSNETWDRFYKTPFRPKNIFGQIYILVLYMKLHFRLKEKIIFTIMHTILGLNAF